MKGRTFLEALALVTGIALVFVAVPIPFMVFALLLEGTMGMPEAAYTFTGIQVLIIAVALLLWRG